MRARSTLSGRNPPALPTEPPALLVALDSGYVQYIEAAPVLEAATEHTLIVRLERLPGDSSYPAPR